MRNNDSERHGYADGSSATGMLKTKGIEAQTQRHTGRKKEREKKAKTVIRCDALLDK